MKFLDLSLTDPAANLAVEELLLDACERDGTGVLRFWESPVPFVVVGYANRVAAEVNLPACAARGVPVLRRCSGGGTVVQGPGCLNYALILPAPEDGPLGTVTGTNCFVMDRNRAALEQLLKQPVSVQGHTDLTVQTADGLLKFSGNAQRRRRNALLFHGTFLCGFDLTLISELLRLPSAQPDYRAGRDHAAFITNLPCPAAAVKRALGGAWNAGEPGKPPATADIEHLVATRYATDAWNLRV
jgi:lipoate-protein ligase A